LSNQNLTPVVSVVMPAHNSEATIATAISSVLRQSHKGWNLIICDDFSSDGTLQIAQQFAQMDSRISLISLNQRGGPGRARNAAIRAATGRWLAFLDSDDLWEPEKLEASLAHALERDSTLVFTAYTRLKHSTGDLGRTIRVKPSVTYRQLLSSNVIATSTVILDRSKVPLVEMREDVFFDDFVLWLELLKKGGTADGLDRPLTFYGISDQSFSHDKIEAARHVWKIYRQVEGLPLSNALGHFFRYSIRGILKHLRR